MKFKFHVPTQQYGFLEIDGDVDELPEMEKFYNKYAETKINFRDTGNRKLLKAWVGGEVYYDDVAHMYTNEQGDKYLSGSVYAQLGEPEFDTDSITAKMAKNGVTPADIATMWMMKADISNGFGTAIHAALELYGKYQKYEGKLSKDYHLHDHPVIKKAVESFYKGRKENALYEALVVDHKRKYAGQIDRVVKEGDIYYIEDFKTNGELKPAKLTNYWKQLSFYASIVEASGLKVGGLRIHHWNGGDWKTYESEVLHVD